LAAIFLSAFFSVFFYFGEQYLTIGFAILRQTVALYQNLVYFYANIGEFLSAFLAFSFILVNNI
jgi:hypothetical protein